MAAFPENKRELLRNASHVAIDTAAARVLQTLPNSSWLSASNRYRADCDEVFFKEVEGVQRPPGRRGTWSYARAVASGAHDQTALCEYVAASAPVHAVDGWSYLGHSLSCLIRGDAAATVHAAYYAELRAAMSILATTGIGVLNSTHPVFSARGQPMYVVDGSPTHSFVWPALEEWSRTNAAASMLGDLITFGGVSLKEWLDAAGSPITARVIAESWLASWGMDLSALTQDRNFRNDASYRANSLSGIQSSTAIDAVKRTVKIWQLLEPGGSSPFEGIDRYLVRDALQSAHGSSTRSGLPLREFMETAAENAFPDDTPEIRSGRVEFLSDETAADQWILSDANLASTTLVDAYPGLLSRAILLLRIATGLSRRLREEGNWSRDDLKFWWQPLGLNAGLWSPESQPPDDLTELWADVEIAIKHLSEWATAATAAEGNSFTGEPPILPNGPFDSSSFATSRHSWFSWCGVVVPTVLCTERIALWGLGL